MSEAPPGGNGTMTVMLRSGYSARCAIAAALTAADVEAIARRESAVYRGASAIFPLSDRLRESFIADFVIPANRVHTVYAGPNFDLRAIPTVSRDRPANAPPTVGGVDEDNLTAYVRLGERVRMTSVAEFAGNCEVLLV